jgi:hypothetical protein
MQKLILNSNTCNKQSIFSIRDVKMGYRRLKETVKEYKRRDAKFYGNMISKLSKVEDTEGNVCSLLQPRTTLHLCYLDSNRSNSIFAVVAASRTMKVRGEPRSA